MKLRDQEGNLTTFLAPGKKSNRANRKRGHPRPPRRKMGEEEFLHRVQKET